MLLSTVGLRAEMIAQSSKQGRRKLQELPRTAEHSIWCLPVSSDVAQLQCLPMITCAQQKSDNTHEHAIKHAKQES